MLFGILPEQISVLYLDREVRRRGVTKLLGLPHVYLMDILPQHLQKMGVSEKSLLFSVGLVKRDSVLTLLLLVLTLIFARVFGDRIVTNLI